MSSGLGLATYTVQEVISEIRALLGSSNQENLTNDQIISNLNQVWQFKLPQTFTHFAVKSLWSFMTEEGVDRYIFPQTNLLNLVNYVTLNNDYLAPFDDNQAFFSNSVGTLQNYVVRKADGTTSSYTFDFGRQIARGYVNILGIPVPQVNVTATGTNGQQQNLYDFGTGVLTDSQGIGSGEINYYTGICTVNFAVEVIGPIYATFDNSSWTRPTRFLFYDNVLTLRNIPNQPYKVVAEVQQIPAPFTSVSDTIPLGNFFLYLCEQTAARIAMKIEDEQKVKKLAGLVEDSKAGIERITTRNCDNQRRRNHFYQPGAVQNTIVIPQNPYPPSIGA